MEYAAAFPPALVADSCLRAREVAFFLSLALFSLSPSRALARSLFFALSFELSRALSLSFALFVLFFFPSFSFWFWELERRGGSGSGILLPYAAMKASVKVRGEGKKPLIRAKLPITILGLPFVSAITAGNAEELALHVGAYLALGPSPSSSSSCSCKLSYRPNDEHRAFTLVLKTTGSGLGLGFCGSSASSPTTIEDAASLSIAAEFNLSNSGNPSFFLRLKPRFGDLSFRKETCCSSSSSPHSTGLSSIPVHKKKRLEDVDRASQASEDDNSSIVLISGADLESHKDLALAAAAAVFPPPQREENKGNDNKGGGGGWRRRMSWLQENAKSWNLFVRNVFPLGRNVVGRVQWGVRFPPTTNNIFHSFGNQESSDSSFSVRSFLPVLVMDKISIESVNPLRRRSLLAAEPRHWYAMEEASSSSSKYGLMTEEEQEGLSSIEQSCQAEHIAAMCCSLQHQLDILHSQNQVLKKTMDNMRIDIVAQGTKNSSAMKKKKKNFPAGFLMMQEEEENMLRSQLFHDLNVKFNGSNPPLGELKATSYHKDSEGKKERHGMTS